jgi:hypothetical protein
LFALITNLALNVISGSILLIFTSFLHTIVKRFKNKERIGKANLKIISIIRPIISQQELIDGEIIDSVVRSVSREFELDPQFLLSINDVKDDCIKEIMQNEFLTTNQKLKMSDRLSKNILLSNTSNQTNGVKKIAGKLSWKIVIALIFLVLGTFLLPILKAELIPTNIIVQLLFYVILGIICVVAIILYTYKLFM